MDGRGFWLGEASKRLDAENSRVVLRIHDTGAAQDRAIGEIIADLVVDGHTKHAIEQFSLARFRAATAA